MTNLTGRGPIGQKPAKPERGTAAGKAHMARVKQLPCVVCAAPPPSDAHHCISGRYGSRKVSDLETIPLCKTCHQDGPEAIHQNKRQWEERHGPDHGYLDLVKSMIGSDLD